MVKYTFEDWLGNRYSVASENYDKALDNATRYFQSYHGTKYIPALTHVSTSKPEVTDAGKRALAKIREILK